MSKEEVKPKEQPMLYSTPMVKALLDGSKTETRRDKNLKEINENPDEWGLDDPFVDDALLLGNSYFSNYRTGEKRIVKKPWRVGNILWCRETWKPTVRMDENVVGVFPFIQYKADSTQVPVPKEEYEWFKELTKDGKFTWKSSMFMRRKFARIFLKITDVKLERIQDITKEGAIAEGIEFINPREEARISIPCSDVAISAYENANHYKHYPDDKKGNQCFRYKNPIDSYKSLWNKINGEESWDKNIFCWVIKFSKIENYK